MAGLRERFRSSSFWVTLIGVAAIAPLAVTLAMTVKHSALQRSRSTAPAPTPFASHPHVRRSGARLARAAAAQRAPRRATLSPLGGNGTPDGPGGVGFATVPAREIHLDESMAPVPANDTEGNAFASPDGRVCVLEMEEFRLRALTSSNGGASFAPEVDVAGGPGQPPVHAYSARRAVDGTIQVAYTLVDSEGDLALVSVRSLDMGVTWTAPVTLVAFGSQSHGVRDLVLETGPAGHVAILYAGDHGWDPYIVSSGDFGVNWTQPVRLDVNVPPRAARVQSLDLAFDSAGTIFAAYTQAAGSSIPGGGGGASVWTTQSFDGGQTFSPPQPLDSLLPSHGSSERVDVRTANDNGVLIAFWDSGASSAGQPAVYCVRALPAGTTYTFTLVVTASQQPGSRSFLVTLATAPLSSTVFLFTADALHHVTAYRSVNNGASFISSFLLTSQSSGSSDGSEPFTRVAFARASSGTWIVGWSDRSADGYAHLRTDVYVRTSTTEGQTWTPQVRVDTDPAGASTSAIDSIVTPSSSTMLVLFEDGRPDQDRSSNLWVSRSAGGSVLPLAPDARIDTDTTFVSPRTAGVALANDGGGVLYSAYPVVDHGPFSTIRMQSSAGCCIATMTADFGGFDRINIDPHIAATPDGSVFLAYVSDAPGGVREIHFNRSRDHGATWLASDVVLGSYPHPAQRIVSQAEPSLGIIGFGDAVTVSARVVWSDTSSVYVSTWNEASLSAVTQDVDQSTDAGNDAPSICVRSGPTGTALGPIFLAFEGLSPSGTGPTVWGSSSDDGGATWSPRVQLRSDTPSGGPGAMRLSCGGGPTATALVAWEDARSGSPSQIFTNLWDGTAWVGEAPVASPPGGPALYLGRSAGTPTLTAIPIGDLAGEMFVAQSTNGGVSYDLLTRVDLAAPDPGAPSSDPVTAADGNGNIWVGWLDESSGLREAVVSRHFGYVTGTAEVFRVSSSQPQGGFERQGLVAALGGDGLGVTSTAWFAWTSLGPSSAMPDAVVNGYGANDFDLDGATSNVDCDDGDAALRFVPSEVLGVTLTASSLFATQAGPTDLSWESQSASSGSATVYDVVTGSLQSLLSTHGYGGATCLGPEVSGPPLRDPRPGPGTGNAFWYLVRAENACGVGTYGDSSILPDPRDVLDGPASPCP